MFPEVVSRVCQYYSVAPELLHQRTRAANVSMARSVACYLAVRLLGHNGVTVGRHLGLGRSGVSAAADRGETLVRGEGMS
jgi:chromosomal replication initiation ATPase DnaA